MQEDPEFKTSMGYDGEPFVLKTKDKQTSNPTMGLER